MEKDRNITNVSHIYKKGAKELFYKIIESALRDYEETASFKLGNKNTGECETFSVN